MDIGNTIITVYEDISDICPLPPLDIQEYLKHLPREICISYGLLMSNYTQEDDIQEQIANLNFAGKIPPILLNKLIEERLSADRYILFSPQTGLELLKYTFSIPKSEFHRIIGERFSFIPLLLAILRINSELRRIGSHFRDKSAILFTKQIRSRKYELDDRITVYPTIYRMFCLLHFLEETKDPKWIKLNDLLSSDLGVESLRDYYSTSLRIIGNCNLHPKVSNTIFTSKIGANSYSWLSRFSFDQNTIIALDDNQDYTYFKRCPLVKLSDNEFGVISNLFISNQLYSSLKFRMSRICKDGNLFNFLSVFNKEFVEEYLLNEILYYSFGGKIAICLSEKDCKAILSKYAQDNSRHISKSDKERLPDGYIRLGNRILLIECKAKIISLKAIKDGQQCIDSINTDIVNEKHGTGQLIYNCTRILEGKFYADNDIPSDFKIYPLIIVDDFGFSADGFNRYVIENTKKFESRHHNHVMPFTVLDLDTFILIAELIRTNKFDIFANIDSYQKYIGGKLKSYSENELFHFSEISFSSYIYGEYETHSPEIIDKWYDSLLL